jgi:D-galactose 1-dehydrogenase
MTIRIGLVGVGKIARDQHVPAIEASSKFHLAATASPHGRLEVPGFTTVEAMLAAPIPIDAVVMCQPPQARFAAARTALKAGKHVMLEKPPGATLGEVAILEQIARERGLTLFASWHSRFAPGVEPARRWLAGRQVRRVDIEWKEDVRQWHPGQVWIWQPGGLGVFDPGINALSIVTAILPQAFFITEATLAFPRNRAAPIAAKLATAAGADFEVAGAFDWRQTGPQTWDIRVETDTGRLVLSKGGAELFLDEAAQDLPPAAEYPGIYARFAELIERRLSDVDLAPLRHVADAFLRGEHRIVEPFQD